MKKWLYELIYRFPLVPIEWIFGPLIPQLVDIVDRGLIAPGRAIDLGCGVGVEAIYLAKRGFQVTGVDFSTTALRRARKAARKAGVSVQFVEDDLTALSKVNGEYDLLLDIGALTDMTPAGRDSYLHHVPPLAAPGSHFLLMGLDRRLPPAEVSRRFSDRFSVETLTSHSELLIPGGVSVYWMTRR